MCYKYSYNNSGALVGTLLFVCIKKFELTAEAPLNEVTNNGPHTAK